MIRSGQDVLNEFKNRQLLEKERKAKEIAIKEVESEKEILENSRVFYEPPYSGNDSLNNSYYEKENKQVVGNVKVQSKKDLSSKKEEMGTSLNYNNILVNINNKDSNQKRGLELTDFSNVISPSFF
jgi:hypothetical protein